MIGKAVVTGGAGFIGSALVDRIVDDGGKVLVVDDLSKGKLDNLASARSQKGIVFHQVDIQAPECRELISRFEPEVVFHLAAQASVTSSVEDPMRDAAINVLGTVNVLAAARDGGAERVVFTSSGGAIYGEPAVVPADEQTERKPDSPYGVSKLVAEDYFRYFKSAYGLDYCLCALANVYGPRQDSSGEGGVVAIFTEMMLRRETPTIFGDGSQTRDFVYVEDVVDALMRGAEVGGGAFLNIGTGQETSVMQLFTTLAELTDFGREPRYASARQGDIMRSAVDSSAAKAHMGWEAWTSLTEGLARTVLSFKR